MSDAAITNDCLHHYDNRHIQVRWDFFSLCAYDKSQFNCRLNGNGKIIKDEPNQECAAKILRILETLTDREKLEWYLKAKKSMAQGLTTPPEPKEFPIQLSYSAICDLLYNSYGESTVRNTVAFLIQRNFIKQYQETKNSIPFYVLRTDIVQKALKDQAEKNLSGVEINSQSGETFQVLKSTARRPKSTAKPLISKGGSSEINSQTSEINNNNNSKNTGEENKKPKENSMCGEGSATQSFVANATSTPSLSLSSQSLSSEETKPKAPSKKKTEEPKGPPIMPPTDAPWSRETAVQIVEAKKGRIYSPLTRKQELEEAGKVLQMTIDGTSITREQFESAWDDLASSSWWDEHGKPCMIKYLRRDDTIVGIIKKLSRKGQKVSQVKPQGSQQPVVSVLISEEKKKRNLERLRQKAIAAGYQE